MSELFSARSPHTGAMYCATVTGELDIATVPVLESEFDSPGVVEQDMVIAVDLSELTFIDSSGLHRLLRLSDRFPKRLRLVNGSPAVERML